MKKLSFRTIILIVPFILLAIFASLLYVDRVQNYNYYQRIQFESAGAPLYANLYHPTKDLDFQDKHPLVIYVHGHGWQKDIDIRAAVELTKRGFFVAAVDYQGHGESGGALDNIDSEGVSGLAQDCINLLDAIEKLDVYTEKINTSQIGLLGHSLGGMVVLMNGARDPRFTATISWAGVVNSSLFGWDMAAYNPVNLINTTAPKNLLLIHSKSDETVNYEKNALVAQNLTGCPIVNITDSFLSAHYLISDKVIYETINWYEATFFGSETINGAISFSWGWTFLYLILTLVAMCFSVFSIMIYISKYLIGPLSRKQNKLDTTTKESNSKNSVWKFLLILVLYIALWVATIQLFGLSSIYITPLLIIAAYLIYKGLEIYVYKKNQIKIDSIKDILKSQLNSRALLYSFASSVIFLGFYYLISLTYPWSLFYPPSILAYMSAFIIFPLYLSSEIIYRKVLYPLSTFIKSTKRRTLLISFIILIFHIYLVYISFIYYGRPALMASFCAFLMSSAMNSIIYHKTKNFSAVLLNSIIINGIFFGSTIPVLTSLLMTIF